MRGAETRAGDFVPRPSASFGDCPSAPAHSPAGDAASAGGTVCLAPRTLASAAQRPRFSSARCGFRSVADTR